MEIMCKGTTPFAGMYKQTVSSLFLQIFEKKKKIGTNFVHILNRREISMNLSTNQPKCGPVVLEISYVILINMHKHCMLLSIEISDVAWSVIILVYTLIETT